LPPPHAWACQVPCAGNSGLSPEGVGATTRFDGQGRLLFPAAYRRWVFLSSGHGMSYAGGAGPANPPFDNVFVDPASFESFMRSGTWPEGTMLVLEIRGGTTHGSINKRGAYQNGDAIAVEVHAKDSNRFNGGWGFFEFGGESPAKLLAYDAVCYSCHRDHAAVDTTFAQFYPTILPRAKALGTLSPAYQGVK
jgi:Cytochrome P460